MKYVWIVVTIIFLVRIDMVLNFIEKALKKVSPSQETELRPGEIPVSSDLVPINSDLTLKVSPRVQFLTIVNDFYVSPEQSGIERALEILKNNPKIFSDKLDKDLEVKIYLLRELIQQKNKLAYDFIYALMKLLKGENLEMLKRFSSLLIDYDLPEFMNYSSMHGDSTCSLSTYLADNIPEEEKYNELVERSGQINNFMNSTSATPVQKLFAEKCLTLLSFQIEKMKPLYEPSGVNDGEGSVQNTASDPMPVTDPIPATSSPGTNP
jgi:hypothetical protein